MAAGPKISIEKHMQDVEAFAGERSQYELFALFLSQVLERAGALYAPLCIVQARAKTVSSFAQKIIRKDKYKEPLKEVTDLCGARIIVHFQSQALKVCTFIKENFIIDEVNSIDVGSKLREEEFGYLSIHYIVTPRAGSILGVPVPKELLTRKAEIQVRTLLQHAWADISHDRIYKSNLTVPKRWKRESARLAAVLEKADDAFASMSETLDAYASNYSVLLCENKLKSEIQTLTTILKVEPEQKNKPSHALKLAKAQAAAGEWTAVVDLLKPYLSVADADDITIEYAFALCRLHKDNVAASSFDKGQKLLAKVADTVQPAQASDSEVSLATHRQARAWHLLGITQSWSKGKGRLAKEAFRHAYELTPTNPYYFLKFVEYEIKSRTEMTFISMLKPGILEAIHTCRCHIEIGLELVNAYFAIARAYYILSEPDQCLNAYAKTVDLLLNGNSCILSDRLDEELQALSNLQGVNPSLFILCFNLLHLARWQKFANEDSKSIIEKLRLYKGKWQKPILIIAGGAEYMALQSAHHYFGLVQEALSYFQGTVISGGTTSGIPGEVGMVAEHLTNQQCKEFELIGYLPKKLPSDAKISPHYDHLIHTDAKQFSAKELIAYWIDLLTAEVNPSEVLVLGINGGRIADLEYRLALAFGAVVGLVQNSGRAAAGLPADPDWRNHKNIVELAEDGKIVWAFVHQHQPVQLTEDQVNLLAPQAHEYYRQKRIEQKNTSDKAMLPWDRLPATLVESNRQQIQFIEKVIKKLDLAIRPVAVPKPFPFSEAHKELMAEIEHARWFVERSLDGWRYGSVKDIDQKINPSLVPWNKLLPEIQAYDKEAVSHFEEILNQAGFEIYAPGQKK